MTSLVTWNRCYQTFLHLPHMIMGSILAWVLYNTGLRETKTATAKERKPIQEWITKAAWLFISWDDLSRGPIKTAFQKLYWGGRETRMPTAFHCQWLRMTSLGHYFTFLRNWLHAVYLSTARVLLGRKSETCRTDLRPGAHGQLFQVQQVLLLLCCWEWNEEQRSGNRRSLEDLKWYFKWYLIQER